MEQIKVSHTYPPKGEATKGEVTIVDIPLEAYALVEKNHPGWYVPVNDEGKELHKTIDFDLVPKGTSKEDVAEFERQKGLIGAKPTTFQDQMAAALGKKGLTSVPPVETPPVIVYTEEDYNTMTPDQLDAVIGKLPLSPEMIVQVRSVKKREDKIKQILTLTGRKVE